MKKYIYIATALVIALAACTKVESLKITPTSGVHTSSLSGYDAQFADYLIGTGTVNTVGDSEYYEELREWKEAAWDDRGLPTRSLSYIFFGDYGSMAYRFADIPDSIDIINLWGGCPKLGSLDYMEMRACQEVKGMKLVGCRITRITENDGKWGMQAEIPSYMEAYEKYKEDHEDDEGMTDQMLEDGAMKAGNAALKADMAAHHSKVGGEYPDWVVYGADLLLNEVDELGLDGYDLDLEPEGDPLGSYFDIFLEYMSETLGPKSGNEGTLLIIDKNAGYSSGSNYYKYCNLWIYQKYGSLGGASPASQGDFPSNLNPDNGWVPCQILTTENVGDTYADGCNNLEQMARFQPSTLGQKYGHKGGFASFYGHRDWRLEAEGAEKGKKIRYQHHRYGINYQAKQNYYSE